MFWARRDQGAFSACIRRGAALRLPIRLGLLVAATAFALSCDEGDSSGGDCREGGCGPEQLCGAHVRDGEWVYRCADLCQPGGDDCNEGVCNHVLYNPDRGMCQPACRDDDDCPEGRSCRADGRCQCSTDDSCPDDSSGRVDIKCQADGFCTQVCTHDRQCFCGSICVDGGCNPGCRSDADCCGSNACVGGTCTPMEFGTAGFAERCGGGPDCEDDALICDTDYAGGFCLPERTGPCTRSTCPAGTACLSHWAFGDVRDSCAPTCDPVAPACPSGTFCQPIPTAYAQGVCTPKCQIHGCAPGLSCEPDGRCRCNSDRDCHQIVGPEATCVDGDCRCSPNCVDRSDIHADGCGGKCGSEAVGSGPCDPERCPTKYGEPCCNYDSTSEGVCGRVIPGGEGCDPIPQTGETCWAPHCTWYDVELEEWSTRGTPETACCNYETGCGYGRVGDITCYPCRPNYCRDRECGSDGCGGSCGGCDVGYCMDNGKCCPCPNGVCDEDGNCVDCTPNCTENECGPDGCGGTCGPCTAEKAGPQPYESPDWELSCQHGRDGYYWCAWKDTCEPNCGGRDCGPDGCTGDCGTCPSGSVCGTDGVCEVVYSGGGGGGGGGGSSSGGGIPADGDGCTSYTHCVAFEVHRPEGPGACDGAIHADIINDCPADIQCNYCVYDGGATTYSCGLTTLAAGEDGGGGTWSCGHSSDATYQYSCAAASDPYRCVDF